MICKVILYIIHYTYWVVCPDFVILGFYTCRHATKMINHHSKAETISNLAVHSKLLQIYFSPAKNLYFVNNKVRAGCPKLGQTTQHVF